MLKRIVVFLGVFLVALNLFAQNLEVKVTQIKKVKGGQIIAVLFDKEDSFLKASFKEVKVAVDKSELKAVFTNIPEGVYGLSVIHDENKNGDLDTNWMGIPKEGYCFGNNAKGTFGPASFKDSSITIGKGNKVVSVKMDY